MLLPQENLMELQQKYIDRFKVSYEIGPLGCWEWKGRKDKGGHGYMRVSEHGKKRDVAAHRISLHIFKELPPGKMALHTCDNSRCVNPEHLYAGDARDNVRDCAERTRRKYPEKFSGENVASSKLTEKQVREIHDMPGPYIAIAKKFDISTGSVSRIKSGRGWAHLNLSPKTKRMRLYDELDASLKELEWRCGNIREAMKKIIDKQEGKL